MAIEIEGYTAVVPNGVYAKKMPASGLIIADSGTWRQQAADATGFLLVSISSMPSAGDVLEKLAEAANGITADVQSGALPHNNGFEDTFKRLKIDPESNYSGAQQILLAMPYNMIEDISSICIAPNANKHLAQIIRECHPSKKYSGEDDVDLVEMVYTLVDDRALELVHGDKAEPESYWSLINPKASIVKKLLPVKNGELPERGNVDADIVKALRGEALKAITKLTDAVYSCSLDELADRTPERWEEMVSITAVNLYNCLKSGALEKLRAADRDKQVFQPKEPSWLERERMRNTKRAGGPVAKMPRGIDILDRDISLSAKICVLEYRIQDAHEAIASYKRGLSEYDARIAEVMQQMQESPNNSEAYITQLNDLKRSRDAVGCLIPKIEERLELQETAKEKFAMERRERKNADAAEAVRKKSRKLAESMKPVRTNENLAVPSALLEDFCTDYKRRPLQFL